MLAVTTVNKDALREQLAAGFADPDRVDQLRQQAEQERRQDEERRQAVEQERQRAEQQEAERGAQEEARQQAEREAADREREEQERAARQHERDEEDRKRNAAIEAVRKFLEEEAQARLAAQLEQAKIETAQRAAEEREREALVAKIQREVEERHTLTHQDTVARFNAVDEAVGASRVNVRAEIDKHIEKAKSPEERQYWQSVEKLHEATSQPEPKAHMLEHPAFAEQRQEIQRNKSQDVAFATDATRELLKDIAAKDPALAAKLGKETVQLAQKAEKSANKWLENYAGSGITKGWTDWNAVQFESAARAVTKAEPPARDIWQQRALEAVGPANEAFSEAARGYRIADRVERMTGGEASMADKEQWAAAVMRTADKLDPDVRSQMLRDPAIQKAYLAAEQVHRARLEREADERARDEEKARRMGENIKEFVRELGKEGAKEIAGQVLGDGARIGIEAADLAEKAQKQQKPLSRDEVAELAKNDPAKALGEAVRSFRDASSDYAASASPEAKADRNAWAKDVAQLVKENGLDPKEVISNAEDRKAVERALKLDREQGQERTQDRDLSQRRDRD